jgi:ATP-dependent exoDNAse (exonuclease V) alpha subunit
MNQSLALAVMLSGESVFLTGPAGTGKTFVLKEFINLSRGSGKHVAVTATTGIAATHLGGSTIHSWSGIGVHDFLPHGFFEHLSKSRREIIERTDVLIIDEISMMHDYRFDMIDEIARVVRKVDEPFGGIQVIISGDFFQLPPVNRGNVEGGNQFAIMSNAWQQLDPVVCYLEDQFRQDDDKLLDILVALREGDVRRHHAENLMNRIGVEPQNPVTELHTTNLDVDAINDVMLSELSGDEIIYNRVETGSKNYVDTLSKSVLAPDTLRLKHGAFVMAVKNSPDKKFANGSLGVVVGFAPHTDYPIVKFQNGNEITMLPDTWELRDGDRKRASITQIPIRLAWAITVHKSQGMTLDAARIDLRKAFVEGMGYVALSRVKNLDNLFLVGINQKALMTSLVAQEIDGILRSKSSVDSKRFSYLKEKTIEEMTAVNKKPDTKSWNAKIAKMREEFPNAYKPWTTMHDADLKQLFLNGNGLNDISVKLGRHEGSIKMRLQKLLGEDIIS